MAKETTAADFGTDVIEASRSQPVLVDFWAPWCGPCRMVSPLLDRLATEAKGRWKLVKVNTDSEQQLAMQYQIQGIPAFKLFKDGEVIGEKVGALGESDFRAWLDEHIPSPLRALLEQAKAAQGAGDLDKAQAAISEALQMDATSPEVNMVAAELALPKDPAAALQHLQVVAEDMGLADRIDAVETLANLLELDADGLGDSAAAVPYIAGRDALAAGDYAAAASAWLEVIRKDRKLDDDGGRRAVLALFRWLGDHHPVALEYRPALASALF